MNKTADENEEVKNRAATAAITSMIGLSCANIHLFANAGEMIWRTPWKSSMARTWMEGRLKWLWRKTDPNLVPDRDHEAGHEADLHPNLGLDPVHVNPTSLPAQTRAKMPTNLSMEKERIQYNCQSLIVFPPSFYSPNHLFFSFLVDSSTFFLGCRCYYHFFCHVLSRSADYMSAAVLIDIYSATISFSFFHSHISFQIFLDIL